MRTERVADGVYASIAEPGDLAVGNAGFVDLGGETLVFDTHVSLAAARMLRRAAEEHEPVRTVVLSHWHGDHVTAPAHSTGTSSRRAARPSSCASGRRHGSPSSRARRPRSSPTRRSPSSRARSCWHSR